MSPRSPRTVKATEPEKITCIEYKTELIGRLAAVKHLMACHGYGLAEANASVVAGPPGADLLAVTLDRIE